MIETEHNTVLSSARIAKIKKPSVLKSEKDILVGDELERLYAAMKNLRDRALIEVLYESGGRINEVCLLTCDQIIFHDDYATVTLESKTDKPRMVALFTSSLILKQWMNQYPTGWAPGKYIFPGRTSNPYKNITYQTVLNIIKSAGKASGIPKTISPKLLRSTRVTDLLKDGVPEVYIKMMCWGSPNTEMIKVYAHLTPTDSVNAILQHMGIETEHERKSLPNVAKPVRCSKCGVINSKSKYFCDGCGYALSKDAVSSLETATKMIEESPEYKSAMQAAQVSLKLIQGEV